VHTKLAPAPCAALAHAVPAGGTQGAQRIVHCAFVALELAFAVVVIDKTLRIFPFMKVLQTNGLVKIVSSPSFRRSQFGAGPSHPFGHYTEFHTDFFFGDITFVTTLASGLNCYYNYHVGDYDEALKLYYAIQSYYGVPIDGSTGGYAYNRFCRNSFEFDKVPYP